MRSFSDGMALCALFYAHDRSAVRFDSLNRVCAFALFCYSLPSRLLSFSAKLCVCGGMARAGHALKWLAESEGCACDLLAVVGSRSGSFLTVCSF